MQKNHHQNPATTDNNDTPPTTTGVGGLIYSVAKSLEAVLDHWFHYGAQAGGVVPSHHGAQTRATLTRAAHGAHLLTILAALLAAIIASSLVNETATGVRITITNLITDLAWTHTSAGEWLRTANGVMVTTLAVFLLAAYATVHLAYTVVRAARVGRYAPGMRLCLALLAGAWAWMAFLGTEFAPVPRDSSDSYASALGVVFAWWLTTTASAHQVAIARLLNVIADRTDFPTITAHH